jgi:DNA-binding CsgD family transcriptional regulator
MCADRVASAADRTSWASWVGSWLHGLIAEATGDGKSALTLFRRASGGDLAALPFYAAHLHLDHARLAHLLGDLSGSAAALDAALTTYRSLNAVSYIQRVEQIRRTTTAAAQAATILLSDRERDVLTLLASGMSYAQIARDLFITQSTVSYHLGNIYAKANVSSRHQLTQLVHQDPAAFGLSAAV